MQRLRIDGQVDQLLNLTREEVVTKTAEFVDDPETEEIKIWTGPNAAEKAQAEWAMMNRHERRAALARSRRKRT